MTASWEVAASRMTRAECITFGAFHALFEPSIVPENIIPVDCRLRGYIETLWYNQGNYDPSLAPGTELDLTTTKTMLGGSYWLGATEQPWIIWAALKALYDAGPQAFLEQTFSTSRTTTLIADLAALTTAGGATNKFYANCNFFRRGTFVTDRLVFPYATLANGNPQTGQVTFGELQTTTTVKVTSNSADYATLFHQRQVNFSAQWRKEVGDDGWGDISGGTSTGGGDLLTSATNGFDMLEAGSKVVIVGCDVGEFNRPATVINWFSANSIQIDHDLGGGLADGITSGKIMRADRQQSGFCVNAVQDSAFEMTLTFSPALAVAPYARQSCYVMTNTGTYPDPAATNPPDPTPAYDIDLDAIVDILVAQPVGTRQLLLNTVLDPSHHAADPLRYHDGVSGGAVMDMSDRWDALNVWIEWTLQYIADEIALQSAQLDFVYYDYEGIAQWFFIQVPGAGMRQQVIDDDTANDYNPQWGFPVADALTIPGADSSPVPGPVADADLEGFAVGADLNRVGVTYLGKISSMIKRVFGAQVVCQSYRMGNNGMSYLRAARTNTVFAAPYDVHPLPNMQPDVTDTIRSHSVGNGEVFLDTTQSPPVYIEHPYENDVDPAKQRYGSLETAWNILQGSNRSFGRSVVTQFYGLDDAVYHFVIGDSIEMRDQNTHNFMSSEFDIVGYWNNRAVDDIDCENLLLEWEQVFPSGPRVPVVLETPLDGTELWGHAYVRSVVDNAGRLVWFFSSNPEAIVTFTQNGDDVDVACGVGWEAYDQTIPDATIFTPTNKQTGGTWVVQIVAASPAPKSWLEYIRSAAAEAIEARRLASGFVFNDFDVRETYYPAEQIEGIGARPVCWLVGLADDADTVSRCNAETTMQPIEVAFQAVLSSPQDTATSDTYVKLVKQLRQTAQAAAPKRTQWVTTSARRDPSGGIVNYTGLREAHTFESYSIVRFRYVAENDEDPPT